MTKHCDPLCKYLCNDYNCCTRPELNGRGEKLKLTSHGYIKSCNSELIEKGSKKNKYNAKKVVVNDIVYDSELEYKRHCELMLLQKAGVISDLEHHKRYLLIDKTQYGRALYYESDFVYNKNGQQIVEDVKCTSTKTRLYRLKKRLVAERYGIIISEYEEESA